MLVARDRARLENVSDELRRDYKIRSEVLVADLSDRAQIGKVAQRLAEDARPVDLLVNNAGYGMKKGFLANEIEGRGGDARRAVHVRPRPLARGRAGR